MNAIFIKKKWCEIVKILFNIMVITMRVKFSFYISLENICIASFKITTGHLFVCVLLKTVSFILLPKIWK